MGKKIFWVFYGGRILVHERFCDVFRGKCRYLKKKKEENLKFYVKSGNVELMTLKRSSEILADEKTYFWGKSHGKVSLAKFCSKCNKFSEIGEEMLHCLRWDRHPW